MKSKTHTRNHPKMGMKPTPKPIFFNFEKSNKNNKSAEHGMNSVKKII